MGVLDYVMLGLVLLAAGAAVFFALRRRRRGRGCAGSCAACPRAAGCGKANSGQE